jgi:LacI family transcriptional regulator
VSRRLAGRPTIVDVARLSGVSKSTVSNVIRGSATVSPGVRERVEAAVRELGYRPNALARQLVQQRTSTIGVVVGDLGNPFYAELVKLLERNADANGYTTMIANTDGQLEREAARVEALLDRRVAGLVMLQFSGERTILDQLVAERIPVVVVSSTDPRVDSVGVDESEGIALAVQHLVRLGHRSLAYATSPLVEERTNRVRYDSFRTLCDELGCLQAAPLVLAPLVPAAADVLVRRLVEEGVTGFAAANDVAALALLESLERVGAPVPQRASVVGFDGIGLTGLARIGLTTVAQPLEEMASVGLRLLLERIAGDPEAPPRQMLLEPRLIVRTSTAER